MRRFLSIRSRSAPVVLLRDYIHDSLYNRNTGYFSNETPPLLRHTSQFPFNTVLSKSAYQDALASLMRNTQGWMTPVELFSPHLSRAIANRLERSAPADGPINIIEIGAGRGTLAKDVLQHWESNLNLIHRVNYVTVEISDVLAKIQENALRKWISEGRAKVVNANALHWFASASLEIEGHCHVIATEVLDNLPHDLVREREMLEQAEVVPIEDGHRAVQWSECTDKDILSTVESFRIMERTQIQTWTAAIQERFENALSGGRRNIWVPTASFLLLRAIVSSLPHAHLTLTDFDSFAGALPGVNAPVVQSVRGGATVVYDDVHSAPYGKVDIMFPTDFQAFADGHASFFRKGGEFSRVVMKQKEFFEEYATRKEMEASTCQDGYNPIVHDFENVSYLLVDHDKNARQ
ncbi:Protein arginine methyltransferase NDUFAF7 [Gracilaria domingensis]|nr:Protein arginine methyltransferase NDUFAF7 [Gracilaria domingensis]